MEAPGSPKVEPSRWRRLLALEWLPAYGRASALFVLSGASLALWAQMAFRAKWVKDFVLANQLEPDKRKVLLITLASGAAAALFAGTGAAIWMGLGRRPLERLERCAWFLSPLVLVWTLPVLFRHSVWVNRAFDLLLASAVVVVLAEGTLRRAFASIPERLARAAARARDRLPALVRVHAATATVWLGAIAYSLFMTKWTIVRHRKFYSALFDLGISDNLMYNALAGNFMKAPVFSGTAGNLNFLANHFQIGQYVFLPIYAIHPTAETLLGIQSFALGLSAIPLYLFSRRRLTPWASALLALCFLAYHPIHSANFYEMTYLPVACPFIIATLWALDAGRYVTMIPFLVIALLMREDISFGLAIASGVFVLAKHRTRAAFVVMVVSTLYFAVVRFAIMPALGAWIFPSLMYGDLVPPGQKKTFSNVIVTLLTNPTFTFSKIATEEKLVFVLHMLVPVAFLPIRRAWMWAALAPGIVTTLLTTGYKPTISLGFHYFMQWVPYIWLAVPAGLALLARGAPDEAARRRGALAAIALATAITSFNFGAFAKHPDFVTGWAKLRFDYNESDRKRYETMRALLDRIPKDASAALTERAGAHGANRVHAYAMRAGPQGAEWILAGRIDLAVDRTKAHLAAALASNEYGVVEHRGEFALLKKGHDTSGNPDLRKDWGL